MKNQSLICAMLLTLVFSPLVVGQGTTKSKGTQAGGVEQQLKQMEDDWQKATRTKDAAALRHDCAESASGVSRKNIRDVLEFAATHNVRPKVTRLPLEEAGKALTEMHKGRVHERAVLVMN